MKCPDVKWFHRLAAGDVTDKQEQQIADNSAFVGDNSNRSSSSTSSSSGTSSSNGNPNSIPPPPSFSNMPSDSSTPLKNSKLPVDLGSEDLAGTGASAGGLFPDSKSNETILSLYEFGSPDDGLLWDNFDKVTDDNIAFPKDPK